MPISVRVDRDRDLVLTDARGRVDAADVAEHIERLPPYYQRFYALKSMSVIAGEDSETLVTPSRDLDRGH